MSSILEHLSFFRPSKTSASHLLLNYVEGHHLKKYFFHLRWTFLIAEQNTPVKGHLHWSSFLFVSGSFPPIRVSLPHRLPSLTLFLLMLQYDTASCCGGLNNKGNNLNKCIFKNSISIFGKPKRARITLWWLLRFLLLAFIDFNMTNRYVASNSERHESKGN